MLSCAKKRSIKYCELSLSRKRCTQECNDRHKHFALQYYPTHVDDSRESVLMGPNISLCSMYVGIVEPISSLFHALIIPHVYDPRECNDGHKHLAPPRLRNYFKAGVQLSLDAARARSLRSTRTLLMSSR